MMVARTIIIGNIAHCWKIRHNYWKRTIYLVIGRKVFNTVTTGASSTTATTGASAATCAAFKAGRKSKSETKGICPRKVSFGTINGTN